MKTKVLILDFGSQFTQLIARRIRDLNILCEIHPFNKSVNFLDYKALILSGSPYSVKQEDAPKISLDSYYGKLPILGICYGAQYIAHTRGGHVAACNTREYGRAYLTPNTDDVLLEGIEQNSQVWMSHGDTITALPQNAKRLASTKDVDNAVFKLVDEQTYGLQFHPEVYHTTKGSKILYNFLVNVAKIEQDWTPENFSEATISDLKTKLGKDGVVLGLSGGVDSTVAATLLHRAIGDHLHCIFVDNGLLRKDEYQSVMKQYESMSLNVKKVDASEVFLSALKNVTDPEEKRKKIGATFVEVFDHEAKKVKDAHWLGQGTIYPDVIESLSVKGPSATIKSHHNVGGLPEYMKLKVVEPLRMLFKDEVRRVGKSLGIAEELLNRHPFPGPGLAIRILGEVTHENLDILRQADAIFIEGLKSRQLYQSVWQAGAILLPVRSVGVMGDERTYERCVALRAVESVDGMTADWANLPYSFLQDISNEIINKVKGINRVVYDISSKPPATIEWE